MTNKQRAGFTLIEVMVVVAIVAILAAVAVPSYQDYVRRGAVTEAMTGLSDFRIKMEQYYQDNRSYGGAACADGANAPAWNQFKPADSRYFSYSCATSNAGQGYTLTATGKLQVAVGNSYTIDHNNARATVTFKGKSSGKACWLVKGDEC